MKTLSRIMLAFVILLSAAMVVLAVATRGLIAPVATALDPEAPMCFMYDRPEYGIADVRIPVLVYHNVRPHEAGESSDQKTYTVSPETFDAQLTYLDDHGFMPVTMDEVADAILYGGTLPRKPVAITFDDGRDSQYAYAMPILVKHYTVATFYPFTNAIGRDGYLDWDGMREMVSYGMAFGSHSVYHPRLYKMTDAAEIDKEVMGSKEALETNLQTDTWNFAYPFGPPSDLAVTELKKAGYETGRMLGEGYVTSSTDPFRIPGRIATDDMAAFEAFVGE